MASDVNNDSVLGAAEEAEKRDYIEFLGKFHFRPTLFVGVGGTGAQAVEKVKSLFLKYIQPQMQKNQSARTGDIDPMYAFLAFDTNSGENKPGLSEGHEWYHLSVSDLHGFYDGVGGSDPFYKAWLVPKELNPLHSLDAGAGGYRNLGRLALVHNLAIAQNAIGEKIQQIMIAAASLKAQDQVPNVHVFCSLSGGTGSGMLLDLCFLLRRMLPHGHRMIGHIAVLHGLPSVPPDTRREVQRNTFVGLKELNAFMSGSAFSKSFPKGLHNEYPSKVNVEVTEPLDECYLIGSHRNDGAINLPTQKHVSSFMARFAFMMTAYSFAGDEPDYEGILANHANAFLRQVGGARTCYAVPGFAQVDFPVDRVADLFVRETARAYIHFQCEGSSAGAVADAREFLKSENLEHAELKQRVSRDPRSAKNLPFAPVSYDDLIKSLLADSGRYQQREPILSYGQKMPAGRLQEIEGILRPNLEAIYNDCWPKILDAVRDRFERSDTLGRGTLGFVNSLAHLLRQERDYLAELDKKQVQPAYDSIPQHWQTVQPLVSDVVTDDGFLDRRLDHLKLPRIETLYVTFLNDAEATTLERAKIELTNALIERLCSSLDDMAKGIKELIEISLPAAAKRIDSEILAINTELFRQTEGTEEDVFNICSVNAMTQEWRQNYLDHKGLGPQQVLANLTQKQETTEQAPAWRPSDLLAPPSTGGVELSRYIAEKVKNRVAPLLEEVRHWTPEDVISMTETIARQKPEDIVGAIYNKNTQPQMQVSAMQTRAGATPYKLVFCGGVTPKLKTWLANSGQLQGVVLNVADNQETHRVNFATATLPIALAGCNLVVEVLENEYDNWITGMGGLSDSERDLQKALFHCFPKSAGWPSPTRVQFVVDELKINFAKALAISEMLEPSEQDLQRMHTASPTIQEVRYGLFQVGGTQYWLWPFFEPNNPLSSMKGSLQLLGSNVVEAYDKFENEADCNKRAQDWINWFEEKWRGFFKSADIPNRKEIALHSFETLKTAADEQREKDMWDKFHEIVAEWDIAKVAKS